MYQAARLHEPQQNFETLAEALDYIQGSAPDYTRPWLRLNIQATEDQPADQVAPATGPFYGNFLIVAGSRLEPKDGGMTKLPTLPDSDQALLDAWVFNPSTSHQSADHDGAERRHPSEHQ